MSLKKLHIATPAARLEATIAFHFCMSQPLLSWVVGIPGIVTSLWPRWDRFPFHNGAPCDQDIESRLTDFRSRRSGGGATQRAERSCRPTADTVPTSC